MYLSIKSRTIKYYVKCLEKKIPVILSRWGDGEIRTVLQGKYKNGHNSNGCTFTPFLAKHLHGVLLDMPDYDLGILRVALKSHRKEFRIWLEQNNIDIPWIDGDVLLAANLAGQFLPLIREIRKHKVMVVGPTHIRDLNKKGFFDYRSFIQVPKTDAIEQKNHILKMVKWDISTKHIDLILWSSGLHSKYFIHEIYKYTNGQISQLDCGSMWDGYFQSPDRGSRSYIRRGRVLFDDLLAVNTGRRKRRKGETFRKKKL